MEVNPIGNNWLGLTPAYEEVRDGVKDRVSRGIVAVGNETLRDMTDAEPPWFFLKLWRYQEKFGGVSRGLICSHSPIGMWDDEEMGTWSPGRRLNRKAPRGRTRMMHYVS